MTMNAKIGGFIYNSQGGATELSLAIQIENLVFVY